MNSVRGEDHAVREPKQRHRPSMFSTLLILCAVATGLGAYMMFRRALNVFF